MNLLQTLRVAWRALMRNKLRSFLTTLGVVIGVGAVIAMVAIGEGAKARVQATFESMGSNLLIILPGSSSSGGARGGHGSRPSLTWEDLDAIRREIPSVRTAAALLRSGAQLMSEDQNWQTTVHGTSPEYFDVRNWDVAKGALFGSADAEGHAKVVLLGQTVVDKLFGAVDPVGQSIRIRNIPFTVIGVLEKKGQSPSGSDYDDAVFIPQSTFLSKLHGGLDKYIPGAVFVAAHGPDVTTRAQTQIEGLLRERHQIRADQEDDFNIRNLTEIASAEQEGADTLTTLLAAIAAVSLLVGGIGIMNIMLVSVTERTREIGLRMAVGAKPNDILAQFLVEALTLALLGGLLGVLLGLLAANDLARRFDWPILVQPSIVLIAVGFSALVGVGFGLYPAHKASRLDPIDALRFE